MAVDEQRFMTKTQHYRKITKPLLERKRRARMNLYLDELKELIVDSMEADGEHIAKLEKADILELTVNYLKSHRPKLAAATALSTVATRGNHQCLAGTGDGRLHFNTEKYCAGYTQAAYEVSKVFATLPGVDLKFGTHLLKHMGCQLRELTNTTATTPTTIPESVVVTAAKPKQPLNDVKTEDVWRPW